MWYIYFENTKGKVVDKLDFGNFRKARDVFDALVLQDFAKAVLTRQDGTFLDQKSRN